MFVYYPRRIKAFILKILIIQIIVSNDQNISLIFLCERLIPCQAMTSVLCLHYRPETVHCSTKDAYTSEITFLALNPCVRSNNFTFRYLRFIPSECRDLGIKKLEFLANLDSIFLFFFYRCCSLIENYPGWIQTEFIYRLSGNIANIQSLRFEF